MRRKIVKASSSVLERESKICKMITLQTHRDLRALAYLNIRE